MKRLSKPLSMVVVSLLSLSLLLTGCGSKSTDTPVAEEKVLTVGVDAPLTGPSARSGQEFKSAVEMAFEEVSYTIGDYKVKLVWIDDQSDPEKATAAYEQAIQKDKIDVGILNWNSSVAVALMETTAKYQIPHFFGFGATEVVNEKYNSNDKYKAWMAKGWASPSKLSIAYVETVNEAIKNGTFKPRNKKIAIYGEDTDWGRSFGATVGQGFKDSGWEIVNEEYFKNGETDLYPVLTKMKNSDASVIAGTVSSAPSVAALIKQAREVNLKTLMIADGLGYAGDWYQMTGAASDGILDNVPLFTTDKAKKFAVDFKTKYNIEPSAAAAGQVYDWTRFFIQIANETLKEHGALNSETLLKYGHEKLMTGQTAFNDGIVMKQLKFDASSAPDPIVGEGNYIFPVVQYFGGQPVVIWPSEQKTDVLKVPDFAK